MKLSSFLFILALFAHPALADVAGIDSRAVTDEVTPAAEIAQTKDAEKHAESHIVASENIEKANVPRHLEVHGERSLRGQRILPSCTSTCPTCCKGFAPGTCGIVYTNCAGWNGNSITTSFNNTNI
jgi:hypothetical protein